ncbi:aldehyde dehydrogenase family protein [Pseudonocardia ailaonensis]|uniref:Aldehyde dehydrogenase family protein n=1 Tax=Pseudonocardia ailaonensis TaxID=367279 RepID=A0ABN2NK09_9PSEU
MSETVIGEARMLIDGKLVDAQSGAVFPNIDPATEQVLGHTADAGPEDMEAAIAAARRAFDETDWATDHAFRRRCIEQLSAAVNEAVEEFRRIDVAELGRPFNFALGSIKSNLAPFSAMAELAETYEYEQSLPGNAGVLQREAIGVVGAILTWNCGFMLWATKVIPALAAGNTVVVRPAPETPWGSTLFGRLVAEKTDIPAGVLNIVTSSNPAVAVALTEDPRVDMITFTGSTKVGKQIMAQAAGSVKKVLLELGGKSANIVLDDGNLQAAVGISVGMICVSSGQACGALSRLLLPRSRYEEGIELAAKMFGGMTLGSPWDEKVGQGPQISVAHRDRIVGLMEKAKEEGARLVVGGAATDDEKGYFIQPTLFADVDPDSTIAQEEVFGPVLVVIPYDDDQDAIRIANNSIYGLFGAVFTEDIERGLDVARRVRTGSVMINGAPLFGIGPFGGYKQSGLGREVGLWGFEEFLEMKGISVPARPAA